MPKMSKWFYVIIAILVMVVIVSTLSSEFSTISADVDIDLEPKDNALYPEGSVVESVISITSTAGNINTITLDMFVKGEKGNVWQKIWSNDVSTQNIAEYTSTDIIGELGNGSYSIRLTVLIEEHLDEPIIVGRTFYVGKKPFGIANLIPSFEWFLVIPTIYLLNKRRKRHCLS